MQFEKGQLYHIFNQGNNRQKIFFEQENYLFFLKKIRTYVLPYADVFAWCLMPNHFHLMVLVNEVEVSFTHQMTPSHQMNKINKRDLTTSIAIMLRSYTRAINKQNNTSGSLFRSHTKAECIDCHNGITPSFYTTNGSAQINITDPELQYPQICFNYIHQNPVKAGLVTDATDWKFSSAQEYAGLRKGTLVNMKRAREYINY